jgi:putative RecB family exonuclease
LARFERTLVALSQAVERARRERDFRPTPSRLCGWCHHQALCPEFGGTPPPFPEFEQADDPLDPVVLVRRGVPPDRSAEAADDRDRAGP